MPSASIVPVARFSAGEISWHRREQPVVTVCGVVPVAVIVPVCFPLQQQRTYMPVL